MKTQPFRVGVFLVGVIILNLMLPVNVRADATASSQISFSNVSIVPGAGMFQPMTNWQGSAYAQATLTEQYNSGTSPSAIALGDYSSGQGAANATSPVNGLGSANASVLGLTLASDQAAGQGSLVSWFMITGGSGPVNVQFTAEIDGSLSVFTDANGQSADAESVFTLEMDGSPVLFDDRVFSIGSNDQNSQSFSTVLNNNVALQYNTLYELFAQADGEAAVSNTPEPGVGAYLAAGALVWLWLRRPRWRSKSLTGKRMAVWLFAGVLSLGWGGVSKAMYLGADPPQVCDKCGYPANRQSGGAVLTSLTEGNLREDYPVVTLQGGGGPTLQLALTYNSYDADGSRAQVDCGVGLGWTHSYNSFLFEQRGSFFRMGPDGRITLYHLGPGGSYLTDAGYFETLTPQNDGSYIVTNKSQSWWRFASVPNTPFLVSGPVYRLTQMGDRNQNVTTLTYSNGLLTAIADTYGRSVMLGYTNKHLTIITDPLGRSTLIQYDSRYRTPIRITDPAGKVVRYSYNSLYQLNHKIDRDGRTYLYLYKNQRPWAVADGGGQTWFSMANPNNWSVDRYGLAFSLRRIYVSSTTTNTDGNGNVWRYQYDTNGYITRVTAPDGATTSYAYDSATRQLSKVTDANGAVTRYQYDADGNRTNMTDSLGNVTTYTYEPVFNQLTSMTDPNGRTTTYQYDARGNRIIETDPLNQTNSWTYDSHGNVTSATDKNGYTTTYTYDAFGDPTNMTDPLGNVTSYTYDAVGDRLSMTDPLGRTTRYQYDALNRLIGVTNVLGGMTTYAYDALGRQTSMTDPNTNTTSYQYDIRGRLIQTTDALGGVSSYGYDLNNNRMALTNELGQVITYTYDVQNRLTGATNALGGVTTYTYDPVGNQTIATDPNGHTTTYSYDALNRRVATTDALGGVTIYDYASPSGPPCCSPTVGSPLITRMQDADGNVTFYHYDELDRRVQVVRKNSDTNDVINPTDAVTTTSYDPVGNVLAVTDPVVNTTVYNYDADNRQTSMIDAAGDTTLTTYDADGNILTTTVPNGNITTNFYDALNRVISVYDDVDTVITSTYDPDGNVTSTTDGLGHATSYSYDAMNRRITATDSLGQTASTAYDAIGNVVTNVDRNSQVTSYAYDMLNRRTGVTDALGHTTTSTYDTVGNVIGITDANGHTTTYGYDALNRQVTETYPDLPPNTRTNVYDAVGNLIQRIDQKGQVTTYSYNDLYFLTNRTYSPSGANDSFTYDNAGRMMSADRNSWVDTFAYDGANRVTNAVENGRTLTYSYNIPGRAQTNTYPSGRTVIYTYDARDRLVSETDGTLNPPITLYTYDAADRVVTRTYRNGATATYAYNANNWVTSLEHSNSLGRIAGFGYAYDNEGNKLDEAMLDRPAISQAYAYDAAYRITNFDLGTLSGVVIPAPAEQDSWGLDAVGNRVTESTNGVIEQTDGIGSDNELTSINGTNLTYDADGNLMQDAAYNYSYDEENRPVQVVRRSDSEVVGQYFYDALGRRVAKIADPNGTLSTNVYFYDSNRIIEDQNAGGATEATYTYGNYLDEVLTMDRAGNVYYYHQDILWNPNALTDTNGNVVERYTYDAYGDVAVLDPSYNVQLLNAWGTPHSLVENPFLFTGREFDEETGIYNYRARYYDSGEGRFLQRDPADYGDGMNLFAYVGDNPVNRLDPSGLARKKFTVVFTANEWVTQSAAAAHMTGSALGTPLEYIPGTRDSYTFTARSLKVAWEKMSGKLKEGDCIDEIIFAGHGSAGSWAAGKKQKQQSKHSYDTAILSRSDLSEETEKAKILAEIKKWWCTENRGVELQMCSQAQGDEGKQFMKQVAGAIGANVTGWEGTYEVYGTGDKYTATPGGDISKTGSGMKGPATVLSDVLGFFGL